MRQTTQFRRLIEAEVIPIQPAPTTDFVHG